MKYALILFLTSVIITLVQTSSFQVRAYLPQSYRVSRNSFVNDIFERTNTGSHQRNKRRSTEQNKLERLSRRADLEDEVGFQADQVGRLADEAGRRIDEAGRRQDEVGFRVDKAGRRVDEAGRRQDEAGRRVDKAGHRQDEAGFREDQLGFLIDEAGYQLDAAGDRKA